MEIGEFPNVRRKQPLVSTESSSAERANTSCRWQEGVTASIGGWQGVNGGLRVDVRCLATHPFSPASPWTAAAPATMPRYQYQPPMLCASTFYQRGYRELDFPLPRLYVYPVKGNASSLYRPVQHSSSFLHYSGPMLNHCPFSSVSSLHLPDVASSLFFFISSFPRGTAENLRRG